MKHSELNSNQNNFGIQISSLEINNKSFSLTDQGISVSNANSNTLMINSVMPTHININSNTILNTSLTNQRTLNIPDVKNYNLAILAKPNTSSAPINSNLVSPLTFHPNNTIKLVNLAKCQQISNLNKDNTNAVVPNNTINVQFVSNTSGAGCTESTLSLQPNCKIDGITLNSNSMTTSITNQTVSTNSSSLGGTRFVIQGASPQFLHQGTLTFIPQTSDMSNNSLTNNHLIKSPKYVFSGTKQQHQTIRPITAGPTSSVISQTNINKQPINIISPSKAVNNFGQLSAFNISDVSNQTVIQDMSTNRAQSVQSDVQRVAKCTSVKMQSYSVSTNNNNNIRLALTSSINNPKIHTNQSKIQLISPKTRKRSGSPLSLVQDGKVRNPVIGSKDENIDNSMNYNNQLGNYSPTRKRARKQYLKSVNTKSQKQAINQNILLNNKIEPTNHLNNIRPALNEKSIPSTVGITPNTAKVSNVMFPNKPDDAMSNSASTPINTQIIIGIKNSIQICPPKTSTINQSAPQRPTSIYTNNTCNNNLNVNNNATITPINQLQIISQNQNIKQIQLPPNFILSPKIKCKTPFSISKVIHIAPSISAVSRTTSAKTETTITEPISVNVSEDKPKLAAVKKEKSVELVKLENSDIKLDTSEDSNVKISLFPVKYQWNARKNHFMKKSDVKFKKSKSVLNSKFNGNLSNLDVQGNNHLNTDVEVTDVNSFLYKAFCQILMQKKFDEENLQKMYQLKEKFDIDPQIDDLSIPVFRKICAKTQFYTPIPDQIDIRCLSKYTDPHLFGISEDVIDDYVNPFINMDSDISEETTSNSKPHECSASCILYSLEVSTSTQPQKFSKIIDLIEGLIAKERNIIEKESEINNQFLKFLRHTTDYTSQNKKSSNKTQNHVDRSKLLTGFRR